MEYMQGGLAMAGPFDAVGRREGRDYGGDVFEVGRGAGDVGGFLVQDAASL